MFADAAAYERFMGRWSAVLAPAFVDAVFDPSPGGAPPAVVLDLGCGTGNLSAELLDRWPGTRVVAMDPASPMAKDGVKAGSVITTVAGKRVATVAELQQVLNDEPDERCAVVLAGPPADPRGEPRGTVAAARDVRD